MHNKLFFLIFGLILFLCSPTFAQDYVGPEKCLTCHNNVGLGDKTGWRTSMHANGYTVVLDDTHSLEDLLGVVNDYDNNGIDDFKDGLNFNNISSNFDSFKPNAPILAYSPTEGYTITMGDATHKVIMTYGGSGLYKQRYMMKVNTSEGFSEGYYVSPVQYNEKTREYVVYHGSDWYDGNTPKYTLSTGLAAIAGNSRNIAKNCSGCHSNGLEVWQDANGEWLMSGSPMEDDAVYDGFVNVFDVDNDGDLDQINTTCERCHGPGGDHVASSSAADIINPNNDLTPDAANNLCGMCHSRGKSKPNATFSFPYNDANLTGWSVGDLVEPIYSDGGGDWGDGVTSSKHHQQFWDLYVSSKPASLDHEVSCYECHDVHNEVKHHIREEREEEDGTGAPLLITTENDNNTLCLSCHATSGAFENITKEMVADYDNNVNTIGAIVSAHTNHSYDPTGSGASRCSKCHMAKTAKSAIAYDIHGHTFETLSPQKTKLYNMPNSCAVSCHGNANAAGGDFGTNITAADLTAWGDAAQQDLADTLLQYLGPNGIWWQVLVSVDMEDLETPTDFVLSQNYPNPFNPATFIKFSTPTTSNVRLVIYDAIGREVALLINREMYAGNYKVMWDASTNASGIYFYRIEAGNYVETRKMVLMK